MEEYVLNGLTLRTTRPLSVKSNPIIIPVVKSTLVYYDCELGNHEIIADNRPGSDWVLFIWNGRRPTSLEVFRKCLSSNCRLIKNVNVLVLLLKLNNPYGCLQVSMNIITPKIYVIENNLGHHMLERLDKLYEYLRKGGDIEKGFGFFSNFNNNEMLPAEPTDLRSKQQVYHDFIKPFIADTELAADEFEQYLELTLAQVRKDKVREHISELVTLGIKMYKEIKHTL